MSLPDSPADTCIKWAVTHGAVVHGLVVTDLPGRGNSLVATAVQNDESIQSIFIPSQLLLTLSNVEKFAQERPEFADILLEWSTRVKMTSRRAIILLIAYSISNDSPWSIYIQSLPAHVNSPLFWSTEECRLLEGTTIQGVAEDKAAFLKAWLDYQQKQAGASEFTKKLKLNDLMRYEMLLDSRALLSDESDSCMVPVIDFANHSSLPPGQSSSQNAVWEMDDTGFHLTTLFQLPADEEVLFSYGKRGNGELLFKYGFTESHQIEQGSRSMTIELPVNEAQSFLAQYGEPSFSIGTGPEDSPFADIDSSYLWIYILQEEDGIDWSNSTFRDIKIDRKDIFIRLQQLQDWSWFRFKAYTVALGCLLRQKEHLDETEKDETLVKIAHHVDSDLLSAVDAVRDAERVTLELNIEKLSSLQSELLGDSTVQQRCALRSR